MTENKGREVAWKLGIKYLLRLFQTQLPVLESGGSGQGSGVGLHVKEEMNTYLFLFKKQCLEALKISLISYDPRKYKFQNSNLTQALTLSLRSMMLGILNANVTHSPFPMPCALKIAS